MGSWKGVYRGWKKDGPRKLELYNLDQDLGEQHDVAAKHPQVVERIEQIMRDAHRPHPTQR